MSEEHNKSMVRRLWEEAWQQGNFTAVDELVDVNHVLHAYPEDLAFGAGAEGLKRLIDVNRTNLPGAELTIEDLIAEEDKVVTRYSVRLPQGATTTGIWIDRIESSRVIESWVDWDRLGFFRQLGLIPSGNQTGGEEK